jgi:hypothetical protein
MRASVITRTSSVRPTSWQKELERYVPQAIASSAGAMRAIDLREGAHDADHGHRDARQLDCLREERIELRVR